jgi:hypothetical protein
VIISVCITDMDGYADHARLTLTDRGHTYHGRDAVALFPSYAACKAP